MGSPVVDSDSENVWTIYCELLHQFKHLDDAINSIKEYQVYLDILDAQNLVPPVGIEIYGGPENRDLDGAYYMGGVNNGESWTRYVIILKQ